MFINAQGNGVANGEIGMMWLYGLAYDLHMVV